MKIYNVIWNVEGEVDVLSFSKYTDALLSVKSDILSYTKSLGFGPDSEHENTDFYRAWVDDVYDVYIEETEVR